MADRLRTDIRRIESINAGSRPPSQGELEADGKIAKALQKPLPGTTEHIQGPPNFAPDDIVQQELTLDTPDVAAAKREQRRRELQIQVATQPEDSGSKQRVFKGPARTDYKPQFPPTKISPRKMEDDWKRATSDKGRPPIGGAQDD